LSPSFAGIEAAAKTIIARPVVGISALNGTLGGALVSPQTLTPLVLNGTVATDTPFAAVGDAPLLRPVRSTVVDAVTPAQTAMPQTVVTDQTAPVSPVLILNNAASSPDLAVQAFDQSLPRSDSSEVLAPSVVATRPTGLLGRGISTLGAFLPSAVHAYSLDEYGVAPALPVVQEALLAPYGLAAVTGVLVALAAAAYKAVHASSIPTARREKGWVSALKSLGAGTTAAGLTWAGLVSHEILTNPDPVDMVVKAGITVAWTLAAGGAGFYVNSIRKNRLWTASKAYADVIRIEDARAKNDESALAQIGKDVRQRHQRMVSVVSQAETAKAKIVSNQTKDSLELAKRYAAFDLLAAGRAELNVNAVSQNAKRRIGGDLPAAWKKLLTTEDAEALSSAFEGKLALHLKRLQAEIATQHEASEKIGRGFESFEQLIPKLFGGQMAEEAARGKKDLAEFASAETGTEQVIYDDFNGAMRGRVSDRLYSEREDFRSRRNRRDRLAALQDGPVRQAVETAQNIDQNLAEALSSLQSEQTYLMLAAANTAVPVTRTSTDSKGNTTTEVTIEDQSGPYRAMAMTAAASASSSASQAQAGFERMPGLMVALHNDPVMASERLLDRIPEGQVREVDGGSGLWMNWIMPPLFGLFSSMGSASSISSTRDAFAPVMRRLEGLADEVGARHTAENGWVNGEIDQDLNAQMARVKS
jgi:hypothetical protein